jgi:hypothetical protein
MPGGQQPRCSECERRGDGRCSACFGSGTNLHLNSPEPKCRRCKGTGVCPSCDGSGYPLSSTLYSELVSPGAPRSRVTASSNRIEIVIPVPRAWGPILILPVFVAIWMSIGFRQALSNGAYFFFLLGAIACLGTLFRLFWHLAGRERIVIDASGLLTRQEIGPFGRTRRFDTGEIRNLRCSPILMNRNHLIDPGTIAFDYGAKTYRIGGGIDEAEANDLIRQLKERLPA